MADKRDITDERLHRRRQRLWNLVCTVVHGPLVRKFNYSYDVSKLEGISGPLLVIPNHACAWDPLLAGVPFGRRQMYYVMSEHMARVPVAGKIIMLIMDPILRRKGSTDIEVVKNCLKHLKAGHSVCIFGEGDQSWDGVTGKVFPATGKLVKKSGATLVTFRLEGAFLSLPRWASGSRRGMIRGSIAGIYTPEELEKMSSEEVLCAIEKDLSFDIWEWQRSLPGGPVEFKGRRHNKDYAKGIEKLFFMCPGCGETGTLGTHNDQILCSCGFRARFLNTGFIEYETPVEERPGHDMTTLKGWDSWQREELERKVAGLIGSGSDEELFSDSPVQLKRIERDHSETDLANGAVSVSFREGNAVLSAGDRSFDMKDIREMGLVLSRLILFSYNKEYYQISADEVNIRKYLLVWQIINRK